MEELEKVKEKIRKLGIIRFGYDPFVYETALKWFVEVSNELLLLKKEVFDLESVENIVEFVINWTYPTKEKDIDYRKGFLLKGKTGRGKSFIFKAWKYFLDIDSIRYSHNNKVMRIYPSIVNVKKISGDYQHPEKGGYEIIEKYSKINCLVLDDIGKEQEQSKSFGNSINVVEEIINNREDAGMLTFGTTNLNSLSELYDDRTVSRMNQLFTGVSINHQIDYRINPNKPKSHE